MSDYFSLLGVNRDATKEDVQKAFMAKALVYHPDKAPEGQREQYEKLYNDLKDAYKILSNDNSRKQYTDSQQTTHLDFKKEKRDIGYEKSDKFLRTTESGVKFDDTAFRSEFEKTRDGKEAEQLAKLQQKVTDAPVTRSDYEKLMEERRKEQADIEARQQQFIQGSGQQFDADTFNRAFDALKKQNPGGLQEYHGDPQALFSTGGLVENDKFGGLSMSHGFGFGGSSMDQIVDGVAGNAGLLDLSTLQTGEAYCTQAPLSETEMQQRLADAMADRQRLAGLSKSDFTVEASEIEKMYSDLFRPSTVEGLDAPVGL